MSNLQKELEQEARLYLQEVLSKDPEIEAVWDKLAIFLIGSGVTQYASEYSGLDLLILVPESDHAAIQAAVDKIRHLPARLRWQYSRPRSPRRYQIVPLHVWRNSLELYQDDALYWMEHGLLLHDPTGDGSQLQDLARQRPETLWQEKCLQSYQEFRRRKASLAWSLRRGHQLVILENLVQILYHTLALCFYFQREIPAPKKWIFRGALRTEFGSEVRGIFYELFRSFGDLATLGGSDNLSLNKIYRMITRIQGEIESKLVENGWKNRR